ncbi:glycosyltransferase family 2 protein [Nocardioides ferulae]|uniref:glycosyltransferase family 2 protein n=1 Tax=Nocardioides ferulae TaxID=2340821 RepID=UPI000F872A7D|nr:glycosyltransferase family 2 protein [Nocardioides ferulae]
MSAPTASVAAVLVSHDGARWLPAVLDGLSGQRARPARIVAVDTGSKDGSAELVEAALESWRASGLEPATAELLRVPSATSFPAALELALEALDQTPGEPCEWVWLLHDDANPDPAALEELLAAAAQHPDADVLGPKLREWPSLRRLLELGVTISGTGRRETGLERGEYDQGQHDEVRTVLAVNTAGMLVRRSVLDELGGLDPRLPMFGNDLDFGWRAAAAGHRAIVVPQAVVFHAEAAHRGVRRTPLTGRHTHYHERRAALWTLLVNSRGRALPFQTVRLALGTLLRMLGFLLVRSVGEALDDLAALVSVYSRPGEVRAARRARAPLRRVPPEQLRPLLAPAWVPYRHGLDFVGDLVSAVTDQAADVAERRRAAAAERDPSSFAAQRLAAAEDDEAPEVDSGLVARFLTNPVAVLLALVVVALVVGAREAFGSVAGGGLSPAPPATGDWWRLYLESWHPLGQGTDVPAPAYLLPLALLASLLGGPEHAVSAVLVLAAPVALWGGWRFLRVVGRLVSLRGAPRWLLLWGATAYALVPVAAGAWSDGRLGPVVTAAVLPWLAHAALGFADPEPDRRWRAAWRSGLLLALTTAFSPVAWLLCALLAGVVVTAALVILRGSAPDRSVWAPPALAVAVVPLLLAPWWLPALLHGAGEGLLLEPGTLPSPELDGLSLLTGRLAGLGAPAWVGAIPALLAVLALLPRATRVPVLVCWVVALVVSGTAAGLALVGWELRATSTPPGLGFLVVVLHGTFIVATVAGAQGALAALPGRTAWRRWVLGALVTGAAITPLAGLGWFLAGDHGRLVDEGDTDIPAYMAQSALQGDAHGILVLRGSVEEGLDYTVRRGDGLTLAEDEVLALTDEDAGFTADVRSLVSRPSPALVRLLADHGVEHILLPAPAEPRVAASLDATTGLAQASTEDRADRAWRLERPLSDEALDGPRDWLRLVLLAVQLVALLAALVLCAPTTERRRR